MRKLLTAIIALATMTACNQNGKVLVLYYSQTGTTKTVAEEICRLTGADIEAFDVEEPYSGTFDETVARCLQEQQEGYVPALVPLGADLKKYDMIFLGYPIWFGTYAPPVAALLKEVDLSGKRIIPFCTFGSGGLQSSVADLRNIIKDAEILDGYGVRTARQAAVPAEIGRFLIKNGFIEGELEEIGDYSEQKPVTEEEAALFDAACSDYQYPLGTPVTTGSRKASWGTDYLFTAETSNPDGSISRSEVYVTVDNAGKAEFTQVVR